MKTLSARNWINRIAVGAVALIALFFSTTMLRGQGVFLHVTPDLTNHVLTINGNGFPIGTPTLSLGGTQLTVISSNSTRIQATLPYFAPGMYYLRAHWPTFDQSSDVAIPATVGVPSAMREFRTPGVFTLTVPSGVSTLMIEAWGGGGGGGSGLSAGNGGSGGAGAYSRGPIDVSPGDTVRVTVGHGGTSGWQQLGGNGGNSTVSVGSFFITSGGGQGGGAGNSVNGAPGIPDPHAPIGRSSYGGSSSPAFGTIQPIGAFGGHGGHLGSPPTAGAPGGNGYVFIQW